MRQQHVERRRVGDQAARRRDDRFRIAPDRFLQRPALVAAVGIRAVERVDLRETAARETLDLARQLDERKPRSSASIGPSVVLPAPRKPTSAIRLPRPSAACESNISANATRARRRSASSRRSRSSRISSHSGEDAVTSPSNSASEHCSAVATCCSTRIDALPMPYSRFARCRSDTLAACATALRVRPRRARMLHALAQRH